MPAAASVLARYCLGATRRKQKKDEMDGFLRK